MEARAFENGCWKEISPNLSRADAADVLEWSAVDDEIEAGFIAQSPPHRREDEVARQRQFALIDMSEISANPTGDHAHLRLTLIRSYACFGAFHE